MRQYENLWHRVMADFKENAKTVIEEVSESQAKTTAKAVRKEKLRDEENWKISFYYELFADYDDETFELTLELRPRRGRTIDGDNLQENAMSALKVVCKAIVKKLTVDVTYCLGDKRLGDYIIEESFPHTLLLTPVDDWRQKIWIPNPEALDSQYVVTIRDQNYYRIEMYEAGAQYQPNTLIWKLKFKLEDLL